MPVLEKQYSGQEASKISPETQDKGQLFLPQEEVDRRFSDIAKHADLETGNKNTSPKPFKTSDWKPMSFSDRMKNAVSEENMLSTLMSLGFIYAWQDKLRGEWGHLTHNHRQKSPVRAAAAAVGI